MGKGYFNNAGRRSGGNPAVPLLVSGYGPGMRHVYLSILKADVRATGLDGADLEEVFARLEATDTDVLKDCVREMRRRNKAR